MPPASEPLSFEICSSISNVDASEWRYLETPDFPFTDYQFLSSLEVAGCVGPESGWQPQYLVARREGVLVGAALNYLRADSFGEYIFDWDWARAYQAHGLSYYPKSLTAIPFTPATGPKILTRSEEDTPLISKELLRTYHESEASSFHALFLDETEEQLFANEGLLVRSSLQFHWYNQAFANFDDFLAKMTPKRRKQIQRERRQFREQGLESQIVSGKDLTSHHAALFYEFYVSTIDRKFGSAYLTEEFFQDVFVRMRDRLLLSVALRNGQIVGGALCFHKGRKLFGRYWGASEPARNMHFELCYYLPIEFAIKEKLSIFEAGAQGTHKLQRGFEPVITKSAHHLQHSGFARAVAQYVKEEAKEVARAYENLRTHLPFMTMLVLVVIISLFPTTSFAFILWHTQDKAQAAVLQDLLKDFESKTKIAVTVETGLELENALLTQLEAGKAPDVVFAPSNLISMRAEFRLSEVTKDLLGTNYSRNVTESVSAGGKIYGVPIIQGNHFLLFRNKKLAKSPVQNLADLATDPSLKLALNINDAYTFLAFYWSYRGRIGEGETKLINEESCARALSRYTELMKTNTLVSNCGYTCVTEDFYAGKHAFAFNGDWALADASAALGENFAWQALPKLDQETDAQTPSATHALIFPDHSLFGKKREAILKFVSFMQEKSQQAKWLSKGNRLPVHSTLFATVASDHQQALQAAFSLPTTPAMTLFWPSIAKGLKFFWTTDKGPAESCRFMQSLARGR